MIAPPRTTELLLESLGATAGFRDALLGDLAEEFALRAERAGVREARRWYRREAVRAAPHLLRDWTRGVHVRDVTHLAGVAATSYVLMAMLVGFTRMMASSLVLVMLGSSPAVAQLPQDADRLAALAVLSLAVSAPVGGCIAAWLHDRAPLLSAAAFGITWASAGVAKALLIDGLPLWYRIGAPVLVLGGALAGGALRVHATRRRARPTPA